MAVLTASLAEHLALMATRAPSVHNTQPWRLAVTEAGLEVYADRSRQLDVIDPLGRQVFVSCGSLVHHLVVAARALGLEATVTVRPDEGSDLVASVGLTEIGESPTREDIQHAEAILHRVTDRTRFAEGPLPEGALDLLHTVVERQGAMLLLVREEDRISLDVLLERAEQVLLGQPAYRQELGEWIFDPQRDGERGDGIPAGAADPGPGRAEESPGRRFLHQHDDQHDPVDPSPRPAERPELVLLTTPSDQPADWVRAGMALSALLLEATELALVAQPLGQVTDVAHERMRLRSDLHLVGVPQLLLRVGWARSVSSPQTPRRPVDSVLSWPDPPAPD